MSLILYIGVFFFKQKTAYEMRISDWSSDVCSSDLLGAEAEIFEEQDRVDREGVVELQRVHVGGAVARLRPDARPGVGGAGHGQIGHRRDPVVRGRSRDRKRVV